MKVRMHTHLIAGLAAMASLGLATSASAATFFGPTPYRSVADVPAGFYSSGAPTFLEDFEDLTLSGGISASAGAPLSPSGITDSVDGDDGVIDGSGTNGRSYFSGAGSTGITFTFAAPVTAAGLVWTDGAGAVDFEAFAPDGTSLGSLGPFDDVGFPGGAFSGQTDEDRFFGVTNAAGIGSIFIRNTFGGIEVDHVQYGDLATSAAIPLPGGLPLYLGAMIVVGGFLRRRG